MSTSNQESPSSSPPSKRAKISHHQNGAASKHEQIVSFFSLEFFVNATFFLLYPSLQFVVLFCVLTVILSSVDTVDKMQVYCEKEGVWVVDKRSYFLTHLEAG